MSGKGGQYRPVDYKKWSEGYDRIFGKNKALPEVTEEDLKKRPSTPVEDPEQAFRDMCERRKEPPCGQSV